MSFSRSLSGSRSQAKTALRSLSPEQKSMDERYAASSGVINGHQRQIAALQETLAPIIEAIPESSSLSGSVWGHAGDDEAGSYGYSLSISCAGQGVTAPRSAAGG